MRAAIFNGPHDVEVGERPDPVIQAPGDAVVKVLLGCVCGSDLWPYRGESPHPRGPIGHEFLGLVQEVGAEVVGVLPGDLVVSPFTYNDGTCPNCRAGVTSQCVAGGPFGSNGIDGGQGEAVRVPFAGSTLVAIPGPRPSDRTMRSLLTLADVMCTGHHAALCAGVGPGSTVAVVGDGAVGLCAVLASRRLGAERIIVLSRNPFRQELARSFGATDLVAERGNAATEAVMEMTGGIGVDSALECVGTGQAIATAVSIARPGSTVGFVGVPHRVDLPVMETLFSRNLGLKGGIAPARVYIPQLLEEVLDGAIDPGRVFDFETGLDQIKEAYEAMDERRAIKSLIRIAA